MNENKVRGKPSTHAGLYMYYAIYINSLYIYTLYMDFIYKYIPLIKFLLFIIYINMYKALSKPFYFLINCLES